MSSVWNSECCLSELLLSQNELGATASQGLGPRKGQKLMKNYLKAFYLNSKCHFFQFSSRSYLKEAQMLSFGPAELFPVCTPNCIALF